MTDPQIFRTLARYNRHMNETLYRVASEIPDSDRKADRGAFFKSVHGTLNHILWADLMWMSRLSGLKTDLPPLGQPVHDDFDALASARTETDSRIIQWSDSLNADWLGQEAVWTAGSDKIERRQPRWLLVMHMFNHQTHHRGQATTLLSQMGLDVGVTDLPRIDGII